MRPDVGQEVAYESVEGGKVLVYAQPRAPEFLSAQESVARDHPWFAVRRLEAVSHFPTLEVPDETADVIREFI